MIPTYQWQTRIKTTVVLFIRILRTLSSILIKRGAIIKERYNFFWLIIRGVKICTEEKNVNKINKKVILPVPPCSE